MPEYRIRRSDEKNWVIEEYSPPGLIQRGKFAGQWSDGSWKTLGYYGKLEHLATPLLNLKLLGATATSIDDLKQLIESAKQEILSELKEVIDVD